VLEMSMEFTLRLTRHTVISQSGARG